VKNGWYIDHQWLNFLLLYYGRKFGGSVSWLLRQLVALSQEEYFVLIIKTIEFN
jgi:hypothetical protein